MLTGKQIAILLSSFLLLGLLAWLLWSVVLYFIISLIVVGILRTPTNYINQMHVWGIKIPRLFAILFSYSILIAFFVLFIYLFVPLIKEQIEVISTMDLTLYIEKINFEVLSKFENFLIHSFFQQEKTGFILLKIKNSLYEFAQHLQFGDLINSIFKLTSSLLASVVAVTFISFFLLYEQGMIRRKIILWIPNQYFEVSITAVYKIERLLSNYLLGLLMQMLFIFTIISVGLLIAEINYAVTIAVFAALINIIPMVGPICYVIFGAVVGLTTTDFSPDSLSLVAAKIFIVLGISLVSDSMFIQPVIFSKSVKAHPLEIFAVIFSGAAIAGPVGMIAAIPVYTIMRVSFSEFYNGYRQYKVFKIKH